MNKMFKFSGYFIVNYDESNWRELMKEFNSFPPVIRGQLVSDSMLLAKAGLLDYSIPLNFVKIVGLYDKNVTLVPIKLALDHLEYLKVMLQNTPSYGQFEVCNKSFEHSYQTNCCHSEKYLKAKKLLFLIINHKLSFKVRYHEILNDHK